MTQDVLQSLEAVTDLQDSAVALWHQQRTVHTGNGLLSSVIKQHRANYDLWHLEDFARRGDVAAEEIAATKRKIDTTNQLRNDLVENIDNLILGTLGDPHIDAALHSETIGMMIDRLSILCLKLYHTEEELRRSDAGSEHLSRNTERRQTLLEQRADLKECLLRVWSQAVAGRVRIKLYRQLKMYNDPALNPQIYGRGSAALMGGR